MKEQVYVLPYPPTINHYYTSGHRLNRRAKLYRLSVKDLIQLPDDAPLLGKLNMFVEVYPPDKRKRDLDNLLKGLQDSLVHAGVMADDSQIKSLGIEEKTIIKHGKVVVTISKHEQ